MAETVWVLEYPRSGGTWIARMLADTLMCPVLSLSHKHDHLGTDPIVEHLDRLSRYVVRRAHWNKKEIPSTEGDRFLLVVRNPLDVAVSCFHHFTFNKSSTTDLDYCVDQVCGIRAGPHMTFDDSKGKLGWPAYNREWMDESIPFVRYTDFHDNARSMLHKTLDALFLSGAQDHVDKAVEQNSFHNTVQYRPKFVRRGVVGGYREILSQENVDTIYGHCGGLMRRLGYEVP